MAKLINGNGNKAIWAAQDADLIASICGNITSIAAVGSQFSYTQEDANTIGVSDGVIITKEGRRIQLDTGAIDLFTIPTGVLGATSYYIIGYKLVQTANSVQTCETFVQKMDNSTDVIPEDTFKGGATEVYVSLYRVTQDGMNIDTVDLLLPKLSNVAQLINNLTASNDQNFRFDYQGGQYGYITESGGADTFHPFSSGLGINDNQCVWVTPTLASVKTITNGSVTVMDNNGGATVLFKADTYVGKILRMHFDDQPYASYMTFGAAIFNGTSWSSRTGTSVVIPSGAKYIVVNAVGGLGSWSGTMSLT